MGHYDISREFIKLSELAESAAEPLLHGKRMKSGQGQEWMTGPRGLREAGKRLGGVKRSTQDNEMAGSV